MPANSDVFLVYGCSKAFLSIQVDSLKDFASVELSHGLTFSEWTFLPGGTINEFSAFANTGILSLILHDSSSRYRTGIF